MRPTFHAAHVTVEDTEEHVVITFADRESNTNSYLILQRAFEFDDQDRRTGMAEVYVERDDQRWSGYGGIERCELLPGRFRLTLDERGAAAMEGIRTMEASFDITPPQLGVLRAGLRRCFAGFNYYVDGAA